MKRRFLASFGVLAIGIVMVLLAMSPTQGQAPAGAPTGAPPGSSGRASAPPPATPWGDPNLQGMWDTRTFTPVERPAAFGKREFMTKEEAAERERLGLRNVVSGDEDETSSNLVDQDVRRYAASDRPDDGRPGYRIEGAEYNALLGASALIKRCHPTIVSEFSPDVMPGISGVDGREYLRFLVDLGYKIAVIEAGGTLRECGTESDKVMDAYRSSTVDHIDILLSPN